MARFNPFEGLPPKSRENTTGNVCIWGKKSIPSQNANVDLENHLSIIIYITIMGVGAQRAQGVQRCSEMFRDVQRCSESSHSMLQESSCQGRRWLTMFVDQYLIRKSFRNGRGRRWERGEVRLDVFRVKDSNEAKTHRYHMLSQASAQSLFVLQRLPKIRLGFDGNETTQRSYLLV